MYLKCFLQRSMGLSNVQCVGAPHEAGELHDYQRDTIPKQGIFLAAK
jgi:hypothetical protein